MPPVRSEVALDAGGSVAGEDSPPDNNARPNGAGVQELGTTGQAVAGRPVDDDDGDDDAAAAPTTAAAAAPSARPAPPPPPQPLVATTTGLAFDAAVRLSTSGVGSKPHQRHHHQSRSAPPSPVPIATAASNGNGSAAPERRPGTPHGQHDTSAAAGGGWPMARWPQGHRSAAFDAVAIKSSQVLSAAETYAEIAHHGAEKAAFSTAKILLLGVAAGVFVGFGFSLCLLVGGNMPAEWLQTSPGLHSLFFGAVGFPFAFTGIVVCGSELFTSMCAYTTAALWEGQMKPLAALRLLMLSWVANFAGCALFVGLALAAGLFDPLSASGPARHLYARALAHKKAALLPWGVCLARAALANMLVAFATWAANAAQDLTGKAVGIWLCISAFAMFGIEHSIANQFLLPMGIALGEPLTAREVVWHNLIPATLGNWLGGAAVATAYALIYGSAGRRLQSWWDRQEAAAGRGIRRIWGGKRAATEAATGAARGGRARA